MPAPRVHQNIFEEFQQRIRQGVWLPGDKIPSITQLAKELQVSTGSIREALRSLQTINMVKMEHGSGVYVTGTRPSSGTKAIVLLKVSLRCAPRPKPDARRPPNRACEGPRRRTSPCRRHWQQASGGEGFPSTTGVDHVEYPGTIGSGSYQLQLDAHPARSKGADSHLFAKVLKGRTVTEQDERLQPPSNKTHRN